MADRLDALRARGKTKSSVVLEALELWFATGAASLPLDGTSSGSQGSSSSETLKGSPQATTYPNQLGVEEVQKRLRAMSPEDVEARVCNRLGDSRHQAVARLVNQGKNLAEIATRTGEHQVILMQWIKDYIAPLV
jgi:hypothetical protein